MTCAREPALVERTVTELLERFLRGEASPADVAEQALARVERLDGEVNAFRECRPEATREMAHASAQRYATGQPMGLLDGIPIAVKDEFVQRTWTTRKGSRLTDDRPDTMDAPTVASCRRHGFVPLGKTTCPEFGWKAVTDSPLTGVTRNPWDPACTPGGSSGGSAVAVALGMAPVALGADAGGSIRIPASFCGLVGMKPTHGRAPVHPASHFGTLAQPGPLARTVRDAAILLDVLSEADPVDPRLRATARRFRDALDGTGVRDLRIAYSPRLGGEIAVDPEVADAVEHVAHKVEELGARVVEADPPVGDVREIFQRLFFGSSARIAQHWDEAQRARMDPAHREVVERYQTLSAIEYMNAAQERLALMQRMSAFHRDFDLLLCPTVPILPFEAGREVPEGWPDARWTSWAPFTYPFNLTGQPAVSVPCAFSASGLPIGAQLVGARHQDHVVLRAACTFQQAKPLTDRRPPLGRA